MLGWPSSVPSVCYLLLYMHYGADGSTSWALYDDDKPVKAIAWEEVAKQQASALIWNRRHPRQQPLDTPTPCIINASVQGSFSLSPQSKDSGADAANSYFTVSSCLQSSCQDAQHVPLPTRFEEPDAAATISPSAFSYPAPPQPPCQAAQGVQLPHEQPDDMTSSAALSAHVVPTPNEEPMQQQFHHHTTRLQVRIRLSLMKSLMYWQPSHCWLPWTLTLCLRPMKSSMPWQLQHHTTRLQVRIRLSLMKSLM